MVVHCERPGDPAPTKAPRWLATAYAAVAHCGSGAAQHTMPAQLPPLPDALERATCTLIAALVCHRLSSLAHAVPGLRAFDSDATEDAVQQVALHCDRQLMRAYLGRLQIIVLLPFQRYVVSLLRGKGRMDPHKLTSIFEDISSRTGTWRWLLDREAPPSASVEALKRSVMRHGVADATAWLTGLRSMLANLFDSSELSTYLGKALVNARRDRLRRSRVARWVQAAVQLDVNYSTIVQSMRTELNPGRWAYVNMPPQILSGALDQHDHLTIRQNEQLARSALRWLGMQPGKNDCVAAAIIRAENPSSDAGSADVDQASDTAVGESLRVAVYQSFQPLTQRDVVSDSVRERVNKLVDRGREKLRSYIVAVRAGQLATRRLRAYRRREIKALSHPLRDLDRVHTGALYGDPYCVHFLAELYAHREVTQSGVRVPCLAFRDLGIRRVEADFVMLTGLEEYAAETPDGWGAPAALIVSIVRRLLERSAPAERQHRIHDLLDRLLSFDRERFSALVSTLRPPSVSSHHPPFARPDPSTLVWVAPRPASNNVLPPLSKKLGVTVEALGNENCSIADDFRAQLEKQPGDGIRIALFGWIGWETFGPTPIGTWREWEAIAAEAPGVRHSWVGSRSLSTLHRRGAAALAASTVTAGGTHA